MSLSHWGKLCEQVLQGLRSAKARFVKNSFAEPAFSIIRLIASTKHSETTLCTMNHVTACLKVNIYRF